ncbi:DUF4115 domain-containing protein, partial [Leptospira borgpetersenii serovar Ballum]|nr:DUF4115 domain-containing protein [Leptospira borgpetersenii serovar Ballum]
DPTASSDAQAPISSEPTSTATNSAPTVNSTAPTDMANNSVETPPQGTAPADSVVVSPSQAPLPDVSTAQSPLPTADAGVNGAALSAGSLVMNFTADCWLQVVDASGKTLFSGIQKGGATLNLSGKSPYKLTIGAPSA